VDNMNTTNLTRYIAARIERWTYLYSFSDYDII